MLIVGNAIVSEDVIEKKFACNTQACHGACCVKGDAGAPLLAEEIKIIEEEFSGIRPFLSKGGLQNIDEQGFHTVDPDREAVTTCLPGGECSFLVYEGLTATCGIENAWKAGKLSPLPYPRETIRRIHGPELPSLGYLRTRLRQRESGKHSGVCFS
jgi:hypothetical protein